MDTFNRIRGRVNGQSQTQDAWGQAAHNPAYGRSTPISPAPNGSMAAPYGTPSHQPHYHNARPLQTNGFRKLALFSEVEAH